MKLFETTKCCFIVDDLKVAGLIIGVFLFISALASAPGSSIHRFVICVICACAWAALVYGIFRKQTHFMIPGFIVACVGLFWSWVTLIIIPIIGLFFHDWLQQFMDERLGKDFPVNATGVLLYYWFFTLIVAVCQWHFASVIYSLRKSMIEAQHNEGKPNDMYSNPMPNTMYPNLA